MNQLRNLLLYRTFPQICAVRYSNWEKLSVPRITVPKTYTDALNRKLEIRKSESPDNNDVNLPSKKKQVIISCKNPRKTHYLGQQYASWSESRLASASWRYKERSKNDYFTILSHSKRPSFMAQEENIKEDTFRFEHLIENEQLLNNLDNIRITKPTVVQALSIPHVLSGRNVVCSSETGSGKTLAYLLPLIQLLLQHRAQYPRPQTTESEVTPSIIVLAPSVELCLQIENVTKLIINGLDLSVSVFINLNNKRESSSNLENSDIVIGTPGYVASLITSGRLSSSSLLHIVLDEADTLLDASFADTVMQILAKLPIQTSHSIENDLSLGVQVILTSATMPQNIEKVFGEYLPIESFQTVTTPYLHRLLPNIAQKFIRTTKEDRPGLLLQQIKRLDSRGVCTILFCNRNDVALEVHNLLNENYVKHICFYKSMDREDRTEAFQSFQDGESHILLTTDLASRGLDTKHVKHVINYEFPSYLSDYLHRIGRVGRVGSQPGATVTNYVLHKWDIDLVQHIESAVRRSEVLENVNADIKEHLQTVVKQRQIDKQNRVKNIPLKPLPTEKDFE